MLPWCSWIVVEANGRPPVSEGCSDIADNAAKEQYILSSWGAGRIKEPQAGSSDTMRSRDGSGERSRSGSTADGYGLTFMSWVDAAE